MKFDLNIQLTTLDGQPMYIGDQNGEPQLDENGEKVTITFGSICLNALLAQYKKETDQLPTETVQHRFSLSVKITDAINKKEEIELDIQKDIPELMKVVSMLYVNNILILGRTNQFFNKEL